jgi:hypothetical protein
LLLLHSLNAADLAVSSPQLVSPAVDHWLFRQAKPPLTLTLTNQANRRHT